MTQDFERLGSFYLGSLLCADADIGPWLPRWASADGHGPGFAATA